MGMAFSRSKNCALCGRAIGGDPAVDRAGVKVHTDCEIRAEQNAVKRVPGRPATKRPHGRRK